MTEPRPPEPAPGSAPAGASVPEASIRPEDAALFSVIDRLAAILDHSDLVELEVQVGATGLTLRKPAALLPTGVIAVAPSAEASAASASAASGSAASAGGTVAGAVPGVGAPASGETQAPARPSVKAPLTGIWYGSPAPGSAPYVQVGGEVAVGQVIGLIEAMKLFNEIKSDLSGRVVKVHAEHGKLVKAKQPLLDVDPL